MTEPTLRTLTLNYYRQQGAKASPLDTLRRRWEIKLDGQTHDVTFDLALAGSTEAGEQVQAIVPGSPRWRDILTDCIHRGAVSFRHIVSAPVSDAERLFAAAVPARWTIASCRMAGVTSRLAVAFTHRVACSAPTLATQPDELHHDVLAVPSGERLCALSDSWSAFATIPIKAPSRVEGIEALHARCLTLVDARSSEQGKSIEASLHGKLAEIERRLARHYVDLRAEVQAREITDLSSRLERVVTRITMASPQELSALREEGAALAKRLDLAKKGRSVSLLSLEKVEADALAAERELYEVTVTTELVSLCIVSFDAVEYELEIVPDPDSRPRPAGPIRLTASYVPVTGQIVPPSCQSCGQGAIDARITDDGRLACSACAESCPTCKRTTLAGEGPKGACQTCGAKVCEACSGACGRCGQVGCSSHVQNCARCQDPICQTCSAACRVCECPLCPSCARQMHGHTYCAEHVLTCDRCGSEISADLAQLCHLTDTPYCVACAVACVECGKITRRDLLAPAGRGLVCPDHLIACGTCELPLLPREAEQCASCGRYHCPDEAPPCAECGLPTCRSCTVAGENRCGVCSQLVEVSPDDERLEPALAAVKDPHARRWLFARAAGGHIVVEWHGRLGAWGRTSLSPGGEVLASCQYGPVAALLQEVAGMVEGRRPEDN